MSLSYSNIEWLRNPDGTKGRVWNPVTGCENWRNGVCGGGGSEFNCWAKRMAERFRGPGGFLPQYWPERLTQPLGPIKPQRIGVCFSGDLFGDWVSHDLQEAVMQVVRTQSRHTFLFLTKCPWNLPKWNPWPDNAWVGASVTNWETAQLSNAALLGVSNNVVKFLSIEPLLGQIEGDCWMVGIDWLILGAATAPYRPPEKAWVEEIILACQRAGIPYFLKNNLRPLMGSNLRQEWPEVVLP